MLESLLCEVDLCLLALCLPLLCEVDIVLALCLASSERLYLLREELCTLMLYLPKSSVKVPCVRSSVWTS